MKTFNFIIMHMIYCLTGTVEVYNGTRLKYSPKRCHFTYKGMVVRNMLATLDHNENARREQAVTAQGMIYILVM